MLILAFVFFFGVLKLNPASRDLNLSTPPKKSKKTNDKKKQKGTTKEEEKNTLPAKSFVSHFFGPMGLGEPLAIFSHSFSYSHGF